MSDEDEDETQIAHKRDLIPDDMETIPEGRAASDEDEETRVAKKSSLLPADMQDMDLNEDSLTQRRQRTAPIRPAAGSRPGLSAPRVEDAPRYRPHAERAPQLVPREPSQPRPQPQPQPQAQAQAQPQQRQEPQPEARPRTQEPPRPQAATTVSTPVALGPPRVFVLVLVACAIFSATGGGLLLYLKMRHLW